jgi:hypothetical protein
MVSGFPVDANQQSPVNPGLLQFNVPTVDKPENAPSHVGSPSKAYVIVPTNEAASAVPEIDPRSLPKVDAQVPVMVEPVWFRFMVIGLMTLNMFPPPVAASSPVR